MFCRPPIGVVVPTYLEAFGHCVSECHSFSCTQLLLIPSYDEKLPATEPPFCEFRHLASRISKDAMPPYRRNEVRCEKWSGIPHPTQALEANSGTVTFPYLLSRPSNLRNLCSVCIPRNICNLLNPFNVQCVHCAIFEMCAIYAVYAKRAT